MRKPFTFYIAWLLAGSLFFAAIAIFALSLNHPISADLAMLHYSAWLINEKSFVLYRDIFEINFPAPYLFHSILGQLIGYEALPLRFIDLALMALLGAISWKILSPVSRPAALLAPSLFASLYMINGGEFALERDFLCLLPAAAAFMCSISTTSSTRKRNLITAILFSLACSMKPNAIVFLPVLLWCLWKNTKPENTSYNSNEALIFFIGMAFVAALPFLWLMQQGGLQDFIEIYQTFMPIYTNSRNDLFHYDSTIERLTALLRNYLIYGGGALLLSAPGLIWAWSIKAGDIIARNRIIQLAAAMFAFTFYEVLAGKFWLNHMFPSAYWTILCLSLMLTSTPDNTQYWKKILAIFLLIPVTWLGYTLCKFSLTQMQTAHDKETQTPENWRARQIANFLIKQEIQPENTVQLLDFAGDGQAALLLAGAVSATRHLIDVPLYMEPSSEATKLLRQEFIQDLDAKKPRFIVYVDQFLHPGGGNRLNEFKPLAAFIAQRYELAETQDGGYTIYRLKPDPPIQ